MTEHKVILEYTRAAGEAFDNMGLVGWYVWQFNGIGVVATRNLRLAHQFTPEEAREFTKLVDGTGQSGYFNWLDVETAFASRCLDEQRNLLLNKE